jgi:RNA polymerase sigma-B factor
MVQLAWIRGITPAPTPVWLDMDGKYFAEVGYIATMPAGYEGNLKVMNDLQDAETAKAVRNIAHSFLKPEAKAPVLFDHVKLFDADKGVKFAAYALPTLMGDLKHYIRDYSTALRPPRSSSELSVKLRHAESELSAKLGRYPTTAETAQYVGVSLERALEALETNSALQFMALDGMENQEGDVMESLLGTEDNGYNEVLNHETVKAVLAGLPEEDRRIVVGRYLYGRTQADIAAELGVTQMTVSRMERRILDSLKKKHGA